MLPLTKFEAIHWDELNVKNKGDELGDKGNELEEIYFNPLSVTVNDDDFESVKEILPILTYISGYCVYSMLKKIQCTFCESKLTLNESLEFSDNYVLIKKFQPRFIASFPT